LMILKLEFHTIDLASRSLRLLDLPPPPPPPGATTIRDRSRVQQGIKPKNTKVTSRGCRPVVHRVTARFDRRTGLPVLFSIGKGKRDFRFGDISLATPL